MINAFLKVFFQCDYYWLPLEQVETIRAPLTLRDLLWTPSNIGLRNGSLRDIFVAAQSYGSHEHPDDLIKLGRMTDWKPVGERILLDMGQRAFFADETEVPLLETRKREITATT